MMRIDSKQPNLHGRGLSGYGYGNRPVRVTFIPYDDGGRTPIGRGHPIQWTGINPLHRSASCRDEGLIGFVGIKERPSMKILTEHANRIVNPLGPVDLLQLRFGQQFLYIRKKCGRGGVMHARTRESGVFI
jgi:hypothetical protein